MNDLLLWARAVKGADDLPLFTSSQLEQLVKCPEPYLYVYHVGYANGMHDSQPVPLSCPTCGDPITVGQWRCDNGHDLP